MTMMIGHLEYRHIDLMIDSALQGRVIPYPIDDDLLDKVRELAADPGSHDPEELRQEGYREVDYQAEIRKEIAEAKAMRAQLSEDMTAVANRTSTPSEALP